MSEDSDHVEPENPDAAEVANRLYVISMVGILGFIAVVFIFIL